MEWVKDKYYYIVFFKDFYKPKVLPVFFTSKQAAKRAIRAIPKRKQALYEIITGKKLKEFQFKHVLRLGKLKDFTKWEYPKELDTLQKRKSFRTLMRRRLRRMGMLTPVKNKYAIGSKVIQGRLVKNRQKVANCPYTLATCFALERKPGRHYIIINKRIPSQKGILYEVDAIIVKKKSIKQGIIRVKTSDIIRPYLITEIINLYGKERAILDRCRESGLRFDTPTQKGFFTTMGKRVGVQPDVDNRLNHGMASGGNQTPPQ
jgi:hypothetical protein